MPRSLTKPFLLLVALAPLAGCGTTHSPAPIAASSLCSSWRHIQIRKADKLTDDTAAGIEGANKARPEWGCQYGANRAKS